MDFPYIILLAIIVTLALLEWKNPASSNKLFKAATAVMFVFIAFRAPVIAEDMWNYTKDAMGVGSPYTYSENVEPLYRFYKSLYTRFCPYIFPFMLVNTLIIFTPIWYLLKKFVKYKTMGVLIFLIMVNYFMFLAALRQCISFSFILWGMIYILENKKFKYLVFVALCAIAFFFHKSTAAFGIVFLFLHFFPVKNKLIPCLAIGLSLVFGVILRRFDVIKFFDLVVSQDVLVDRYQNAYLQVDDVVDVTGGFGMVFRPLVAMIVFLLMDKEKVNHWFSKAYLTGIVIYNMLFSMYEIQRVVFPFMMFAIAAVPFVLEGKAYKSRKLKLYVKTFIFIALLYFCRSYVKSQYHWRRDDAGRLHPYYFIWQDYSKHPAIHY